MAQLPLRYGAIAFQQFKQCDTPQWSEADACRCYPEASIDWRPLVSSNPERAQTLADLEWQQWRVDFRIEGGRVSTLPRPRPGFEYGHSGHGRDAILATHIGDRTWTDYLIDLDFMVLPVHPDFAPHHIPEGTARGFYLLFRVQDLKESWNEPGRTSYRLSFNENGNWGLNRANNLFSQRPSGYGNLSADCCHNLVSGTTSALNLDKPNHLRLRVEGQRFQACTAAE